MNYFDGLIYKPVVGFLLNTYCPAPFTGVALGLLPHTAGNGHGVLSHVATLLLLAGLAHDVLAVVVVYHGKMPLVVALGGR